MTSVVDLYLQNNTTFEYWDIDDAAASTGSLTIDSFILTPKGSEQISFKCPNCVLSDHKGGTAELKGEGLLK